MDLIPFGLFRFQLHSHTVHWRFNLFLIRLQSFTADKSHISVYPPWLMWAISFIQHNYCYIIRKWDGLHNKFQGTMPFKKFAYRFFGKPIWTNLQIQTIWFTETVF